MGKATTFPSTPGRGRILRADARHDAVASGGVSVTAWAQPAPPPRRWPMAATAWGIACMWHAGGMGGPMMFSGSPERMAA